MQVTGVPGIYIIWFDRSYAFRFPLKNFRFSNQPMETVYTAWLYRKGFLFSEKINSLLMWINAFGLLDAMKDNGGIFSPTQMNIPCDKLDDSTKADVRKY